MEGVTSARPDSATLGGTHREPLKSLLEPFSVPLLAKNRIRKKFGSKPNKNLSKSGQNYVKLNLLSAAFDPLAGVQRPQTYEGFMRIFSLAG